MGNEWVAFPAGVIIATLATLVGFGGGLLWMPYLLLVAGLDPSQAVTTSLAIQVGGMGSGSWAVIKARKADVSLSWRLAAGAFLGIPAGVALSRWISPASIVFLMGVFSLAMALVFVYTHEEIDAVTVPAASVGWRTPYPWLSTVFAILTGLLSMGVGDFLVPILRNRLRLSMESAMSACLILMAVNAVVAVILHVAIGDRFALAVVLWAFPGVVIGGQIGPRLAGRIQDQTMKEIFIFGLSLAGIHMMLNVQGM